MIDPTQEDTYRSDVRTVLDVYVPARSGAASVGAIEVVLNYAPTAAATGDAVRNVAMLVLAGLGVVWILLFRTVRNASKRLRQSAAENARLALLDPLTGLPNRRLLPERLERAVAARDADGAPSALLLLDLDRFKEINDTLGHTAATSCCCRSADGCAQPSSATRTPSPVSAATSSPSCCRRRDRGRRRRGDRRAHARRLRRAVRRRRAACLHVEASSASRCSPTHGRRRRRRCCSAPTSRCTPPRRPAPACASTPPSATRSRRAARAARGPAQGDRREDELVLHYQPKVDLATGEVAGVEALLRWQHPTRGLIPPSEFIPLAEQTGLIHSLTRRVLRLALEPAAGVAAGGCDIPVAVNLSALNLAEPDLDREGRRAARGVAACPRSCSSSRSPSRPHGGPRRAPRSRSRGSPRWASAIALDDFGTGYTSLA